MVGYAAVFVSAPVRANGTSQTDDPLITLGNEGKKDIWTTASRRSAFLQRQVIYETARSGVMCSDSRKMLSWKRS